MSQLATPYGSFKLLSSRMKTTLNGRWGLVSTKSSVIDAFTSIAHAGSAAKMANEASLMLTRQQD